MPSRYVIVRCVPDTIAEEFINIGYICWSTENGSMFFGFLNDWSRVENFADKDSVECVKDFAHRLIRNHIDVQKLKEGLERGMAWINLIQFSEPRGSLEEASYLSVYLRKTFLKE